MRTRARSRRVNDAGESRPMPVSAARLASPSQPGKLDRENRKTTSRVDYVLAISRFIYRPPRPRDRAFRYDGVADRRRDIVDPQDLNIMSLVFREIDLSSPPPRNLAGAPLRDSPDTFRGFARDGDPQCRFLREIFSCFFPLIESHRSVCVLHVGIRVSVVIHSNVRKMGPPAGQ